MQLRVIGAHLPRLDQAGITAFIANDVETFKATIYELVAKGIAKRTYAEIDRRALELPEELNTDLQRCALFELEIQGNDREFDPTELFNPDTGYVAWEPAFLTLDGEAILTDAHKASGSLESFRVAFYIHEWNEPGRLKGPMGELVLPPFTPVPPRLWKLAPYACL
jgi:hypothetical protein